MTDEKLIEKIAAKDTSAFEQLVNKYQTRLYNLVYQLTNASPDSPDIVQEIFIKVYEKVSSFKGKSSVYTWLYRLAVNTALDYLKKVKRKKVVAVENIEKDFLQRQDNAKTPFEKLRKKEVQDQVRRAISKLPDKYRTVIMLREIEGASYREISQILGRSIGTIESRLFRARVLLQEYLKDFMEEL